VILQADIFHNIESTTVCLFTSDAAHAPTIRIPVYPTPENGLRTPSWLMVDKLVTVPRDKLGTRVGILDPDSLSELQPRRHHLSESGARAAPPRRHVNFGKVAANLPRRGRGAHELH
jgi:mRNA interferase MazF